MTSNASHKIRSMRSTCARGAGLAHGLARSAYIFSPAHIICKLAPLNPSGRFGIRFCSLHRNITHAIHWRHLSASVFTPRCGPRRLHTLSPAEVPRIQWLQRHHADWWDFYRV